MKSIFAAGKIFLFLLITIYYYSFIFLGNTISVFRFNNIAWSAKITRIWANSVAKLIGMKVVTKGTPPKPPFFLVSNHLSYVDVWVLYSQLHCTFIAKSEVRTWPVIGFILASCGVIFVNREKRSDVKRVNTEVSIKLNNDRGIVLFPEGSTSIGAGILPFKSSLFQFPASNALPVCCASITYKTPDYEIPAYNSVCWWDDTSFFKHLFNLFGMKGFTATVTFSDEKIINSNRKLLANTAEQILRNSFEPVIDFDTYEKVILDN